MPDKVASQLPYPSSWLSPSEFAPFVSRERGEDHEHIPATLKRSEIQWDREPGVAQAEWGWGLCPRGDGKMVEKWEPGQEKLEERVSASVGMVAVAERAAGTCRRAQGAGGCGAQQPLSAAGKMFPLFSLGSEPGLTSATPAGIVRNLS